MSFEQLDELTKKLREYPNLKSYQNAEGFFDSELFPQPEDLENSLMSFPITWLGYLLTTKVSTVLRIMLPRKQGIVCALLSGTVSVLLVFYTLKRMMHLWLVTVKGIFYRVH